MGKVVTGATMSIDGYIAGPGESGFDLLFQWYDNGDVATPTGNPDTSCAGRHPMYMVGGRISRMAK